MHHLVDRLGYGAALRLSTLPKTHPLHLAVAKASKKYVKRHRTPLHELMDEFEIMPERMEKIELVRFVGDWESSMAVSKQSLKEEAEEADTADTARWKVYTDGSGIDGKIGVSAVLYRDGVKVRTSRKRLGSARHHTVFEGEGVGGNLGLGLLWAEPNVEGDTTIAVDSTPAIDATASTQSNPSHYIWDLWHKHARIVQRKHLQIRITIRWCPGHRGIDGNERADVEAKKAAQEGSSESTSIPSAF
ncbi:ribonuclease H-like domain-containing protein [Mycena epipterygia]|nr:ribonuclease H-like domain-containing protein [Mycena epipterygia]